MNNLQLCNLKELLEPEELESWETKDFDDLLLHVEASEQKNEIIWNDISGLYMGSFH